jgi:hypothetical protein
MTQRARRPDAGRAASGTTTALCPTEWAHEVQIAVPGVAGSMSVISLSCPSCTRPSVTEELSQIVAARRRTLTGLAGLPAGVRGGLAATGTLQQLYRGTLTEVREAAERCRDRLGVRLPKPLEGEVDAVVADRERVTAVLDAASTWLTCLGADPRHVRGL